MTDGQAALERGDWPGAKQAFELSLQQGDDPEALEGLGLAAWWLDLAEVVFDARERAYRVYRERDDRAGAARMAVWIAWDTAAFRGEQAVANGWLQRARRLLEGHPDAPENAWLALRAGVFALLDDGDPEHAEKLAGEAVRIGQRLEAVDYEMVGRALHGFARVAGGDVTEGLRELDEVNAAVLAGEMTDRVLIRPGLLLPDRGLRAHSRLRPRGSVVRSAQGVVREVGTASAVCRVPDAIRVGLHVARRVAGSGARAGRGTDELAASRPAMTGEGLVRLGELRRRQGKLDEAISLFERRVRTPSHRWGARRSSSIAATSRRPPNSRIDTCAGFQPRTAPNARPRWSC